MIVPLVTLLCAYVAAASNECTVGSWGPWSDWESSKHCRNVPKPAFAYPMEVSEEWDIGREKMKIIMEQKEARKQHRAECIPAGTCPELMKRPTSGQFDCVDGLASDIPCMNIDQMSFVNFDDMGYTDPLPGDTPEGNDIWGWTDPLNGDEYAIMGLTGGTAFVRVTDASNPVPVGFMYSRTSASTWRDMKVIGNYVYIVSEARDHGLQVFDLTHLRGRDTVEYFTPDATNSNFGNAHNIVENVDTNFIYVVGATQTIGYDTCQGGLLVIDVSNPLDPTFVGCFGGDGYVHDAQCVIYNGPDTRYSGNEICFCYNEDSFTIVDVTDKSNMFVIAKSGYINVAYTHQGWVTDDHSQVLLDDELDENGQPANQQFTKTYWLDISDLTDPQLVSVYESAQRSIDHNQYIIGDYTFQANYEAGLRILRLNRQSQTLTEVAYFDVFPSRTAAQFFGSWSVYPYFSSGNIIISSIDYGLFVVRPDWAGIESLVEAGNTYSMQTRTRPLVSNTPGATCPSLVETKFTLEKPTC